MPVRRWRKKEKDRRNETDRKKEKHCKLGVFRGTSDFNIYRGNLILNILVLSFETRNCVHRVQLQE